MSFETLSAGLADAVAAIQPSVLGLRGRRRAGSALAVSENKALTAAHLVRKAAGQVVLPDGSAADAKVVGLAPALDLAVIEVDANLTPASWADEVRVGNLVVPVAYGPRATLGLIARLGGAWRTPAGAPVDQWIEVDGSLPAGFSGGPLVASGGAVIGLNTHRLVRGGTTLPASTLKAALEAIEKRGSIEPGFLGIGGATATLTPDQAAAAGQDEALLVVAVEAGSPAEGVLTVGDIVLRVDGTPVKGVRTLRGALTGLGAGHEATLDVLSALEVDTRAVTLGTRPADTP